MRTLNGKRYLFRIDTEKHFLTFIAFCKRTKRYSHINNLNTVLTELGVNLEENRFEETTWEVTYREKKRFVRLFTNMVHSTFLEHLERQLDVDRGCGEWENKER